MSATNTPLLAPPRQLTWQGSVEASAFWLPVGSGLISEAEARRRVVSLWRPGAVVYRLESGDLLVVLSAPQRGVRPQEALGTPAVRLANGLLSTAPVSSADAARLMKQVNSSTGAIALVRGGVWALETLDASRVIDPAAWLELGNVTVETDVVSLGAPPAPVENILPPAKLDPRQAFGKVAVRPAEYEDLIATLPLPARAGEGRRPGSASRAGDLRPADEPLGTTMARSMLRMVDRLTGRKPSHSPLSGATRSGTSSASHSPSTSSSNSANSIDLRTWLRWRAAQLARLTGLGGLIKRQQAEYISNMLEMFERGNLDEALRHAIPLGGSADNVLKRLPPSLFTPRPRTDLSIHPGKQGGSATSSITTSPNLHSYMQSLYRQAFERLERAGRIDEAAFVLAELLQANEEAVNFLEKHGRLPLAADMAEARGLSAGWVLRLRFLAGDSARALAFARRTGAWAEAISQLERSPRHAKDATSLRLAWAASLARAGDYAQAVEVALPLDEARHLVREWMGRVVAGGGVPAARMAARRLALFPADDPTWHKEALALLAGEEQASARERRAFIEEIARPGVWPEPVGTSLQRMLARAAVRTVARDISAGVLPPPPKALYDALLQLVANEDPALKADAPPLNAILSAAPAVLRHRTLRDRSPDDPPLVMAAEDTGLLPIHDAAHLPSGRTLVALGEMGVRLLAPDGRTLRSWATVPAHRLVPTDSGNIALALARRGRLWSITRLNAVTGAANFWCEAEIPVFAPDSDGSLWMVALPNGGETQALTALDLQGPSDRVATLWRTPLDQGKFVAINRSSSACMALSIDVQFAPPESARAEWQAWKLAVPSLVMRDRILWENHAEQLRQTNGERWYASLHRRWQSAVDPSGTGTVLIRDVEPFATGFGPITIRTAIKRGPDAEWSSLGERVDQASVPAAPVVGYGWLADISYPGPGKAPCCFLVSLADGHRHQELDKLCRLCIVLEGAERVGARLSPGALTVWDDRGRILAFDLDTGDVRADLRVR